MSLPEKSKKQVLKKIRGSRKGKKFPRAKADVGPFYKAEYSLAVCKKCGALYYKKSWHHGTDALFGGEKKKLRIQSVLCPADMMIQEKLFEGELIIENIPERLRQELIRLIHAYGERAYKRDCQHRVIAIEKRGKNAIRVTTTENQLANKLAKKIKSVFNKVAYAVQYSKEPYETERIHVKFL